MLKTWHVITWTISYHLVMIQYGICTPFSGRSFSKNKFISLSWVFMFFSYVTTWTISYHLVMIHYGICAEFSGGSFWKNVFPVFKGFRQFFVIFPIYPVSSIQCPVSNVQYPGSSVQYPASSIHLRWKSYKMKNVENFHFVSSSKMDLGDQFLYICLSKCAIQKIKIS